MVKRLTPADMKSHEELMEERRNYTDEQARQFGYPSVYVLHQEDRLTWLAGAWRETKDDRYVKEYAAVLNDMILHGYDVDGLDIEDQLPEALMPQLPPRKVREAILKAYAAEAEEADETEEVAS